MYMKYVSSPAAFQLREKMFYDDISHFYVLLVGTFLITKLLLFNIFINALLLFRRNYNSRKMKDRNEFLFLSGHVEVILAIISCRQNPFSNWVNI